MIGVRVIFVINIHKIIFIYSNPKSWYLRIPKLQNINGPVRLKNMYLGEKLLDLQLIFIHSGFSTLGPCY